MLGLLLAADGCGRKSSGGESEDGRTTPVEGTCVIQISGCCGPNAVYCCCTAKAAASISTAGRRFSCR